MEERRTGRAGMAAWAETEARHSFTVALRHTPNLACTEWYLVISQDVDTEMRRGTKIKTKTQKQCDAAPRPRPISILHKHTTRRLNHHRHTEEPQTKANEKKKENIIVSAREEGGREVERRTERGRDEVGRSRRTHTGSTCRRYAYIHIYICVYIYIYRSLNPPNRPLVVYSPPPPPPRIELFGGVRLGVWGVVLVVCACVCRCRGCCSLSVCVCVTC